MCVKILGADIENPFHGFSEMFIPCGNERPESCVIYFQGGHRDLLSLTSESPDDTCPALRPESLTLLDQLSYGDVVTIDTGDPLRWKNVLYIGSAGDLPAALRKVLYIDDSSWQLFLANKRLLLVHNFALAIVERRGNIF